MTCLVPLTWREDVLTNGAKSANFRVEKAALRNQTALTALQAIETDLKKLNLTPLPSTGVSNLIAHYKRIISCDTDKQEVGISPFSSDWAIPTDAEYHSVASEQMNRYRALFEQATNMAKLLPEFFPTEKMRHQNALESIIKQCGRWFLKWTQIQTNPARFRNQYVVEKRAAKEVVGYLDSKTRGKGVVACIYDVGLVDVTCPLFSTRILRPAGERREETGDVEHATTVAAVATHFAPNMRLYSIRHIDNANKKIKIPACVRVVNMSITIPAKNQPKIIQSCMEQNRVLVRAISNYSFDISRNKILTGEFGIFMDPRYAFRGLLVAALAVDGVTPARYTNLPGEHFWKFTVYAPGKSEVMLQPGSQAMEGTSIAAPIVTALVATILSTYPTLTGEEAVEAVKEGAEPIVPGVGGIPYALASQRELNDPKYNSVREMSRCIWGMGRINFAKALAVAGSKVRARMIQIPQPVLLPPATSSPSFHVNPAKRARDEAADESRDHLRRKVGLLG